MKNRSFPKNRTSPPARSKTPQESRGKPHSRASGRSLTAGTGPALEIDLYGVHAVREAVLNPNRVIRAIFATEEQADEVDEWVRQAAKVGIKRPAIKMPSRAAFDAALPRDAVHQGVGVACDPLAEVDLEDILRGLDSAAPGCFVMLDQVTDPHNMGAIIRSACAFGAVGLIVQRRHAPDLNALIAKTACGAVEHLPVCYETNLSRSIEVLKEARFYVIGLDERGEIDLPDVRGPHRSVLVLGAEGPGLRRLIREGCDQLVRLPTRPPIGSLNVSNAAAVALYHLILSD